MSIRFAWPEGIYRALLTFYRCTCSVIFSFTLHTIWRNVDFYVPRDCVQRDIQGLEITVPLDKWCNYTETAIKWTWLLCCFKFRNRREERDNSTVLRSCSRVKGGRGVVVVGHVLLSYIFRAVNIAAKCLHLRKTRWDYCMCSYSYCMDVKM